MLTSNETSERVLHEHGMTTAVILGTKDARKMQLYRITHEGSCERHLI